MKFPSVKFQYSDKALDTALSKSAPRTEFPTTLHASIIRAVRAVERKERTRVSGLGSFQRFIRISWMPVTGLAALVLLSVLLALYNRPKPTVSPESLTQISAAFSASQDVVDALPSVTVGPLSEELDKVNQDLDRTAEFLLATLP
jgi:hypothetical protein